MNLKLEPQRPQESGRKTILLGAAVAAVIIAAIIFVWMKSATNPGPSTVEGMLRPGDIEFQRYRGTITIEQQKATLSRNYMNTRVISVSGVIHNGSDRWVDSVEVQVSLKAGDQIILQQKRMVVGGGNGKPLPPRSDYSFSIWIEQLPKDWTGGPAEVEISGFRFARIS
ncbi:MAG TPA: hypothetical protein VGK99_08350 [Acidobacteriota bacterium]|jgi:hypothetical protein